MLQKQLQVQQYHSLAPIIMTINHIFFFEFIEKIHCLMFFKKCWEPNKYMPFN